MEKQKEVTARKKWYIVYVSCDNCDLGYEYEHGKWTKIEKGTQIKDCVCKKCGCKTLNLKL